MNLHPMASLDSQHQAWKDARTCLVYVPPTCVKRFNKFDIVDARAELQRVRLFLRSAPYRANAIIAVNLEPFPKHVDGDWVGDNQPDDYEALMGMARGMFPRQRLGLTGRPSLDEPFDGLAPLNLTPMPNLYPRKDGASAKSARKVLTHLASSGGLSDAVPMVSCWVKVADDQAAFEWAAKDGDDVLEICRAFAIYDAAVWLPSVDKCSGSPTGDPVADTLAWMVVAKHD